MSMYEKKQLTLQSVFNRGECMMHVDKNVDGHVMDQNLDWISKEIGYVPLGGRIRSKRSSCMQFFFEWVQDMLTSGHDKMRISVMLSRGPTILNFWRASQRSKDLNFGRASQRSDRFEVWTCFAEVRWIWSLDVLPRGPMDLWKVIFVPMRMGSLP